MRRRPASPPLDSADLRRRAGRGAVRRGPAVLFFAAALGLLLALAQGTAMAKLVSFSAIKGRVLMDGKPAAGAVVVRQFNWGWKDEDGTDQATTDATGAFALPAIERRSLTASLLPHEPLVRQVITIRYEGRDNGENGGRPIDVTCRLDAQRRMHGEVMGLCEFD